MIARRLRHGFTLIELLVVIAIGVARADCRLSTIHYLSLETGKTASNAQRSTSFQIGSEAADSRQEGGAKTHKENE